MQGELADQVSDHPGRLARLRLGGARLPQFADVDLDRDIDLDIHGLASFFTEGRSDWIVSMLTSTCSSVLSTLSMSLSSRIGNLLKASNLSSREQLAHRVWSCVSGEPCSQVSVTTKMRNFGPHRP